MAIPIAVQSCKIYFLEFPYMTKTKDALTNTSEVDIWSRYLFHSDPFCRLQKHGWGKPELFPNLLFYPKSRSKTPSSVRLFHQLVETSCVLLFGNRPSILKCSLSISRKKKKKVCANKFPFSSLNFWRKSWYFHRGVDAYEYILGSIKVNLPPQLCWPTHSS